MLFTFRKLFKFALLICGQVSTEQSNKAFKRTGLKEHEKDAEKARHGSVLVLAGQPSVALTDQCKVGALGCPERRRA